MKVPMSDKLIALKVRQVAITRMHLVDLESPLQPDQAWNIIIDELFDFGFIDEDTFELLTGPEKENGANK